MEEVKRSSLGRQAHHDSTERLSVKLDDSRLIGASSYTESLSPQELEEYNRYYAFMRFLAERGWQTKIEPYITDQVPKDYDPVNKIYQFILDTDIEKYKARLEEEMGLIYRLGFVKYFLVIWDIYNFIEKEQIPRGPARGSVCASLLAYLLGIIEVDPLKHDLLFFRFISPERIDYPDVDMDFADRDRGKVKRYLEERYGEDKVASIATFSTLKGKQCLRDVARVFKVPIVDTASAASFIITRSGGDARADFSIEDSFSSFSTCIAYKRKYPDVVKHAALIEGQIRNTGVHASGVVVSNEPLSWTVPLASHKDIKVALYEMKDIDDLGLLKMDILGLRTLTIFDDTLESIRKRHQDCDCIGCRKLAEIGVRASNVRMSDLVKIDYEDQEVLKMFGDGFTKGVFQFESFGITKLVRRAKPTMFYELAIMNGLHRPGPIRSGIMSSWEMRREGKQEIPFIHDKLTAITKRTQGCITYQEQIMLLAHDIGNFVWSDCELVRKTISKSVGDEYFGKFREDFIEGATANGIDSFTANNIFDQLCHYGSFCVTGDTNLRRASIGPTCSSFDVTVRELWDIKVNKSSALKYKIQHGKYGVMSLIEDEMRVKRNTLIDVISKGDQEVFEVTTESGKKVKTTMSHPFLTDDGFVKLEKLQVGSEVITCDFEYEKTKYAGKLGKHNAVKGKSMAGSRGFPSDERNPGYVDGSYIALKASLKEIGKVNDCQTCGYADPRLELHHIDGDHWNNTKENLEHLCPGCHKSKHYSKGRRRKGQKGYPVRSEKIISIVSKGIQSVYDVSMEGPNHNFLGNGFVLMNCFNEAHSVAYAYVAYRAMYLKKYFPLEFLTASLNLTPGREKVSGFITEARRLGIAVKLPDINHSKEGYFIERINGEDCIRAGFLAIKGIGEKAAEAIAEAAPYEDWNDFVGRVNRRRCNKRVIKSLVEAGALDSLYSNGFALLEGLETLLGSKLGSREAILKVARETEHPDPDSKLLQQTIILGLPTEKNVLDLFELVYGCLDPVYEIVNIEDISTDTDAKHLILRGVITEVRYGYRQSKPKPVDKTEQPAPESEEGSEEVDTPDYTGGAYINLDDRTDFIMGVFLPNTYEKYKTFLESAEGLPVLVRASKRKNEDKVYIDEVTVIPEFQEKLLNEDYGSLTPFEEYLLQHPIKKYQEVIDAWELLSVGEAKEYLDGKHKDFVRFACVVTHIRTYECKTGEMAFTTVEDGEDNVEVIIWPDAWEQYKKIYVPGASLAIRAKVLKKRDETDDNKFQVGFRDDCKIVKLEAMLNKLKEKENANAS